VGRCFLPAALAAGYRVRALVREPTALTEAHANLEILIGDVLHGPTVAHTIAGCDIVVSLIGHRPGSKASLQSKAGHYITQAMLFHEVRRVISLTTTAVRHERDEPGWTDKVGYVLRWLRNRRQGADARRHARLLLNSGVAWEIVRVPRLTDGPRRGSYRLGLIGHNAGSSLSRADLVDFLLQELETEERLFQMPVVSY
jgi:putative NADH-flavin reductase